VPTQWKPNASAALPHTGQEFTPRPWQEGFGVSSRACGLADSRWGDLDSVRLRPQSQGCFVNPRLGKASLRPTAGTRGPLCPALIWGVADLFGLQQRAPLHGADFPAHGCSRLISVKGPMMHRSAMRGVVALAAAGIKAGLVGAISDARSTSSPTSAARIFQAPTSVMPYSRAPIAAAQLRGAALWRRSQADQLRPQADLRGLRPVRDCQLSGCALNQADSTVPCFQRAGTNGGTPTQNKPFSLMPMSAAPDGPLNLGHRQPQAAQQESPPKDRATRGRL